MGKSSSSRGGASITLIVVHTSEGATNAASLVNYLNRDSVKASYHRIVDDTSAVTYLPDTVASWSVLSGNPRALSVCLTGWARWSRDEWLSHDRMLRLAAGEVREWCATHRIPTVKLSPAEVGRNERGICGHWDWTIGKREGTHTDPGPGFPWDRFLAYITGSSASSLASSSSAPQGVLDMPMGSIPPGPQVTTLTMPIGPSVSQVVARGWLSLTSSEDAPAGHVWIHGARGGISEHEISLRKDRRWVVELPDGTDNWTIHTNSPGSVGWCLELKAP